MRTFDLAPLYRSTVGFDRLFSMLDGFEAAPGYPPYNIERTGENDYRITVAVAGFGENELSIEAKENTLTIKGEKQVKQDNTGEVLYQGIAARAFERQFQLADYVQVKGASLENGLLHVDLVREIPEAKKPRQIAINGQSQAEGGRGSGGRLTRACQLSGSSAERSAPGCPRGAFILRLICERVPSVRHGAVGRLLLGRGLRLRRSSGRRVGSWRFVRQPLWSPRRRSRSRGRSSRLRRCRVGRSRRLGLRHRRGLRRRRRGLALGRLRLVRRGRDALRETLRRRRQHAVAIGLGRIDVPRSGSWWRSRRAARRSGRDPRAGRRRQRSGAAAADRCRARHRARAGGVALMTGGGSA